MTAIDQRAESDPTQDRRAELADNLATVERRIEAACAAAGRHRSEVTLVVVTKTFPASDVRQLTALGVGDVGENKVQELLAKDEDGAFAGVRRHLLGRLQSNKARIAAEHCDTFHALDRADILPALARGAETAGHPLTVLIQVSLDGDPARGGVAIADVPRLGEAVLESTLRLGGVMAIPPVGTDPGAGFARLREVSAKLTVTAPEAGMISAGMSADLEAAVANAATHLRVGSAILGSRASRR